MAKRSTSPCFAKADLKPKDIERLENLAAKYNSTDPNADYAAAARDMIAQQTALRDAIYNALVAKAKGAPLESRSAKGGSSTVESVKKAIYAFMPIKSDVLTVLANPDELPKKLRDVVMSQRDGKQGRTQGLVYDGKAYLFADNITPGDERAVFMHEVGSHIGLDETMDPSQHASLAYRITEWAEANDGSLENKIATRALQRVLNAGVPQGDRSAEMIAYFIEEAIHAGVKPQAEMKKGTVLGKWFANVVKYAQAAVDRFFGGTHNITVQDVVDMAYGRAAQAMANGRTAQDRAANPRDAVPKYSDAQAAPSAADIEGNLPKPLPAKISSKILAWARDARSGKPTDPLLPVAASVPVLQMLGYYRPVVLNVEHSRHLFGKHREVRPEDIAALPDLIQRPRAIESYKDPKSGKEGLRVYLDARDEKGNPLIVGLTPTEDKGGKFKITSVDTAFGKDQSAQSILQAAQNNRLLYAGKGEIARIQELQSRALVAPKAGSPATTSVGGNLNTIVLSDRALAAFKADPKGLWETMTEPVGTNRKAISAVGPSIRFSVASPVSDAARRVGGASSAIMAESATHAVKKLANSMLFLHDIVDKYKKAVPAIQKWYDAVQDSLAARNRYVKEAERIGAMASALKDGSGAVNEFLSRSTFEQKWGYTPSFKATVTIDPALKGMYDRLTGSEQEVVRAVFEHGENMRREREKLMTSLGVSTKFLDRYTKMEGPYAPLKRFGNYAAVLKSQAMRDAEAANDTKLIEKLKSDQSHYVYSLFDTKGQARQFAWANDKANGGKFEFTDDFEKSARPNEGARPPVKVVQDMLAAMKVDKAIDPNAYAAAEKLAENMILQYMDEQNARTSSLRRLNRAGYDADMMRSFMSHAGAEASFLSNLQHGGAISTAFAKMNRDSSTKNGEGYREHQDAVNMAASHYSEMLNYKETPWQDRAMALTSAMQLATSVGYHVNNFMQNVMVTLPKLAADFGDYTGAWKHMIEGYGVLRKAGIGNKFDINKVQNAGVRAALQLAMERGVLDVGMNEDLSHFEATRTGIGGVDATTQTARSALHKLNQVARAVEISNRVSSAAAAYNMAISKGKSPEDAKQYALRVLQSTQGDFSRTGAPLLLKKLPKVMTQYKKYQFMMGALYAKAFSQAFFSADPTEKAIGRRMLTYKLAHTGIAAGVLGLPLMNVLAMVLGALGRDDEPPDLERDLRQWVGDESLANLLLHGPLSAIGLDMSSKLGDDKIFSIMPYGTWDFTSANGLAKTAAGLAGPAASQGMRMAEGVGFMGRGDYYRGTENFMPKGVSDAMKAFRVANEGFSLKNGDVMFKPEDINGFALALDALGMPSSEMKRMEWLKGQQYEIGQFYQQRTKDIERSYAQASSDGDTAEMGQLRQDWMDLQSGKNRLRYLFNDSSDALKVQPLSNLLKYPQTQAKREQKLQRAAGVTG